MPDRRRGLDAYGPNRAPPGGTSARAAVPDAPAHYPLLPTESRQIDHDLRASADERRGCDGRAERRFHLLLMIGDASRSVTAPSLLRSVCATPASPRPAGHQTGSADSPGRFNAFGLSVVAWDDADIRQGSSGALGRVMALFRGRIRRWQEDGPGGLAVIDIPVELAGELGGRRQMRMAGSLNGVPFAGSTMLVAGGGFCVGVSRAALRASGVSVGDEVDVQLERAAGGAA